MHSVCNVLIHARMHAHPFNSPLSGTTQVRQYLKGKTNLDFTEARDSEWQVASYHHPYISNARISSLLVVV